MRPSQPPAASVLASHVAWRRRARAAAVAGAGLLLATLCASPAFASDPFGQDLAYRTLPWASGKWVNPRTIVWVLSQLHLLFAAFVLAVPMFAVIIEIVGLVSRDKAQAKRYDNLAHEFTRLLTTAFSATAILGALFTFICLGLYPKLFNYLVQVFGPTMYLYATIFFGESFSLYLYYYGWGKFNRWLHAGLGLVLNAFGITLMLIANAWTTFMMAPAGIGPDGAVIDRHAAFFNFLLNPINIHRLIANLCLGGSVAAAYAAYKFLSTKDPEQRAHYDWMGYIGNFIAILALLPLPFAGYYLGFEIYLYNQQLGIYMMGGILSWLFIMQAVLIGVLFLSANYYFWLGMDRIEGAERYRGWIKFLLGVITLGVIVWSTPRSLILTPGEIDAMKGTSHPILSIFGVMSAKNTAVNLIILSTFLSFILYRRGNKVPTVKWAPLGKAIQALAFGGAAAAVVVIGIGGYIPSWWMESSKRIAMSPWQVVAVLACMVTVMAIDIPMFANAREIGRIRWGQVSARSQYVLLILAVSFTWLMGLMGFVRSSLRQHWHVYEVMKDESPWAYTPALGYATIVITAVVFIFFLMVSLIFWITNLGAHEAAEAEALEAVAPPRRYVGLPLPAWIGGGLVVAVGALAAVHYLRPGAATPVDRSWVDDARSQRLAFQQQLTEYAKDGDAYRVPIDRAIAMVVSDPSLLAPVAIKAPSLEGMTPAQHGELIFSKLQPCATCHSTDGTPKIGPSLKGKYGSVEHLADGTSVTVDDAYIKESIITPTTRVTAGFQPLMPPFQLSDQDMAALIAYIKTLQ